MIYSLNYRLGSQYKDKVGELRIRFTKKSQLDDLIRFIRGHKEQRIFIEIEDFSTFYSTNKIAADFAQFIQEEEDVDYTLCIAGFYTENEYIKAAFGLSELGLNYCFFENCGTYDMLHGLLELGVSDVYIANELGFSMDKIADIVHSYNAKVRVYPDLATASWDRIDPLFKFWIRPEDMDKYEEYIDVVQFYHANVEDSPIKEDTYYKIYTEDKEWYGDLGELIAGVITLDSRRIIDVFGEQRVTCDKMCMRGGGCKVCHYVRDLAAALEETEMIITRETERKNVYEAKQNNQSVEDSPREDE